jgi:hypothetical protein
MLFALLLVWSVSALITYVRKKRLLHSLGIFAFLLRPCDAHASLCRIFISIVLIVPFFILRFTKKALIHSALGLVVVVLTLSPWLIRNYHVYHVVSLSSLSTQQMLNAVIPQYMEWKEKGTASSQSAIEARRAVLYEQAKQYLGHDISNRFTVDLTEAKTINTNMVTPFLKQNYLSLFYFFMTQLPFQMLTDNWRTALDITTQLPHKETTPLSASLAAAHGDFSQIFSTFSEVDLYLVAFIAGKLYWLLFYILALIGAGVLWRREATTDT